MGCDWRRHRRKSSECIQLAVCLKHGCDTAKAIVWACTRTRRMGVESCRFFLQIIALVASRTNARELKVSTCSAIRTSGPPLFSHWHCSPPMSKTTWQLLTSWDAASMHSDRIPNEYQRHGSCCKANLKRPVFYVNYSSAMESQEYRAECACHKIHIYYGNPQLSAIP